MEEDGVVTINDGVEVNWLFLLSLQMTKKGVTGEKVHNTPVRQIGRRVLW